MDVLKTKLKKLYERKKIADSLPESERIKWQSKYNELIKEINDTEIKLGITDKKVQVEEVPEGLTLTSKREELQCKMIFDETTPKEIIECLYDKKIKIVDFMDIIKFQEDETKQLKYMVQFFNQYLLIRFNKAQELKRQGYEFNSLQMKEYKNLKNLIDSYINLFIKRGIDVSGALEGGISFG